MMIAMLEKWPPKIETGGSVFRAVVPGINRTFGVDGASGGLVVLSDRYSISIYSFGQLYNLLLPCDTMSLPDNSSKRQKKTNTWKKEAYQSHNGRNIPFLLTTWSLIDSKGSMLGIPTGSVRCLIMEYKHRPLAFLCSDFAQAPRGRAKVIIGL